MTRKQLSLSLVIFNLRPDKERDIVLFFCSNIGAVKFAPVALNAQKLYRPVPK